MGLGQGNRGYAMAALLIGLNIMAILMSAALPVWSHAVKRMKEEELIWRGQQYARAIGLFQRRYANTFPPNVDVLVEQRFLRRKYKDPMTNADFQVIPATGMPLGGPPQAGGPPQTGGPPTIGGPPPAAGPPSTGGSPASQPGSPAGSPSPMPGVGIQGVVSKSTEDSIKVFNGRTKYNEWLFVYLASAQRIGGPPAQGGQPPGGQVPGPFSPPFNPGGGTERRPLPPAPSPGGSVPFPRPFDQPPPSRPPGR